MVTVIMRRKALTPSATHGLDAIGIYALVGFRFHSDEVERLCQVVRLHSERVALFGMLLSDVGRFEAGLCKTRWGVDRNLRNVAHYFLAFLLADFFNSFGLPIGGGVKPFRSLSGISHPEPNGVSSKTALGSKPSTHHFLTVRGDFPYLCATALAVSFFGGLRPI